MGLERPDRAPGARRGTAMSSTCTPLAAAGVDKTFGRRRVLSCVSLDVSRGEIVCLVGENGSGKSTLLKILAGWLSPDRGRVTRSGSMGYCPQEALVFTHLTVLENIRFFAAAYGLPHWQKASAGLLGFFELNGCARQRAGELSGGTRQKLNLSLALMADPALLLLDEPYAGFDWETYERFWEQALAFRRRGRTVIMASHFIHQNAPVDRVLTLRDGELQ
jgi:ABC-type multidrug transport system ATPase subunit